MDNHRFSDSLEPLYLPQPQRQSANPGSFMACPLCLGMSQSTASHWQQNLYQIALMQAQAVHQPPITERLFAVANN